MTRRFKESVRRVVLAVSPWVSWVMIFVVLGHGAYQWRNPDHDAYVGASLLMFSALSAVVDLVGRRYQHEEEYLKLVRYLLGQVLNKIGDEKLIEKGKVRANVMLEHPKRKVLSIVSHVRMESSPDLDLEFEIGRGCVGEAFRSRGPIFHDLSQYRGKKIDDCRTVQGQLPFGLTERQWWLTHELGGVLSVPLIDPDVQHLIIGTINVDSKESFQSLGIDHNALIPILMEDYGPIVSVLLRKANLA